MLERYRLFARGSRGPGDVKLVRGPEGGGAVQHRDPPLPGQRLEPARQSPHHTLGPAPQRFGLDPRCAEIDAVLLERPDLVDEPGDVQERLRRDAADVQAHAPEVGITLDEHGLLAEIGGAEGASVTPGPRPDHRDLGLLYRAHRRMWRMSESTSARRRVNPAAATPSMTRWS